MPNPVQPMHSLFSIRLPLRPRRVSTLLSLPAMSDADFQKLKTATTPIFNGAIAKDDENKKDFAGAIAAFTSDLKAYPDPTMTQSGDGLNDTYLLGQAYAQQTPPDLKSAAWFLTRAAQFAPPQAKPTIEKAAEYFYNKYHGSMDGYPAVQALARTNLFPPAEYNPTRGAASTLARRVCPPDGRFHSGSEDAEPLR